MELSKQEERIAKLEAEIKWLRECVYVLLAKLNSKYLTVEPLISLETMTDLIAKRPD